DVFALGVILFRMLSRRMPFPEDGAHWTQSALAPPQLEVAGLPPLGDLVGRMLNRDPVERPRDGGEVLAALNAFEHELSRLPLVESPVARAIPAHGRSPLGAFVAKLGQRLWLALLLGL